MRWLARRALRADGVEHASAVRLRIEHHGLPAPVRAHPCVDLPAKVFPALEKLDDCRVDLVFRIQVSKPALRPSLVALRAAVSL